jgi:hypothetical protein
MDTGLKIWLAMFFIAFGGFIFLIAYTAEDTNQLDAQRTAEICSARNGTLVEDVPALDSSFVRCTNSSGVFYVHRWTGLKLIPVIE